MPDERSEARLHAEHQEAGDQAPAVSAATVSLPILLSTVGGAGVIFGGRKGCLRHGGQGKHRAWESESCANTFPPPTHRSNNRPGGDEARGKVKRVL